MAAVKVGVGDDGAARHLVEGDVLMVSTSCATTLPPLTATPEADRANWFAWRALSAFCLTVLVSSSMEAAVCASELACSSVRDDKSTLPAAIWLEAVAMVSVPWRTWPTIPTRLVCMAEREAGVVFDS